MLLRKMCSTLDEALRPNRGPESGACLSCPADVAIPPAALRREFRPSQISKSSPAFGTTLPEDESYRRQMGLHASKVCRLDFFMNLCGQSGTLADKSSGPDKGRGFDLYQIGPLNRLPRR